MSFKNFSLDSSAFFYIFSKDKPLGIHVRLSHTSHDLSLPKPKKSMNALTGCLRMENNLFPLGKQAVFHT